MHAWQPELVMAQPLQWYEDKADNLALDQRACRTAAEGDARGPLLPARPGDHHCDRPVRREGAGQPRLLSQQAVRRRLALPRQSGRGIRNLTGPNSDSKVTKRTGRLCLS